ncbi:hypothetical protein [Lentzea flava]|uniref:hypothetical protein n=1 Tax=Lentzea flava TaxID=103732 RepID=UPI0016709389|nr:hypothetical protein [Lentzea flava]MCP2204014.1 hypothetical protein [Lentzea flava]
MFTRHGVEAEAIAAHLLEQIRLEAGVEQVDCGLLVHVQQRRHGGHAELGSGVER